jgi:hypothetical protein
MIRRRHERRGADEMQRKKRHGCESQEERNGELRAQRATEGDDPADADRAMLIAVPLPRREY